MHPLHALLVAQSAGGFLSDFDPNQKFVLMIIGISCTALLILVLGGVSLGVWESVRRQQIEADLKRDMLDRGMTSEEVEKVIQAKPLTGMDRWIGSWNKKC